MTTVAYIVRRGDDNEELRYSLRSLINMPHTNVLLVGHHPTWARSVDHLPVEQVLDDKQANAVRLFTMLSVHGPDEFVLFNDDFFCMSPVAGPPPVEHRGMLIEHARRLRGGRYGAMLHRTAAVLAAVGYRDALAYTMHKPMTMSRRLLADTMEFQRIDPALSWRSMYGNLCHLGGAPADDVKLSGAGPVPRGPWISTSDASFKYHKVGEAIRQRFPLPSPYET